MANFTRNFIAGKMNKTFDERVVPDGEYIDAMNVRMGSTEKSEAGVIENTNGNLPLTVLSYAGNQLSTDARCIGAINDSARETLYWFVHDSNFTKSNTNKIDLVVSFNMVSQALTYHIVSMDDGGGINTTLNFNPDYLITGVDIVEDLLFWTDDYNQPRFININRGYANPDGANIDYNGQPDLLKETILVIKKPPTEAPTISLVELDDQSNFLEERFICFAYRYRYDDGQYSATSQWTELAFFPNDFQFSPDSYLNEGMINRYNGVNVFFNTGGPLVVGIDLLFKEATSNVIKVIEKYNKQDVGWGDNTVQSYLFSNSKIYTILPESELLRLYDNVPRLAKAQTIMGNRIMYGNYVDGYDLVDANGYPTKLEYSTQLVTEEIVPELIPTATYSSGNYTINGPVTINDCVLNIDLSGVPLKQGNTLIIDATLEGVYSTNIPPVTPAYGFVDISFSFVLPTDYTSVYQMASSTEFQDAIGTVLNIKPIYNPIPGGDTSCDGYTMTDAVNCVLNYTFGVLYKYEGGINGPLEPIAITASPSSNIISLQFVAIRYTQLFTNPSFNNTYIYYRIANSVISVQSVNSNVKKSLHSNRDYEIGIVYMDEFLRATPANVSLLNNEHVACRNAQYANSITVTIPPSQIAPYWAKWYKFVCKADQHRYETIYSNIFFLDPNTQETYFLLQGENARKVEEGDRFIVKADSEGPMQSCVYATVLEKESKASGFIPLITPVPPAGVYMKIKSDTFSVNRDPLSYISFGTRSADTFGGNICPMLGYPMNIPNPAIPGQYIDYDVPAGSIIVFDIQFIRDGYGDNPCETRRYLFRKQYVAANSYANMYDWFINDNIAATLNDGIATVGTITGSGGPGLIDNQFIAGISSSPLSACSLGTNFWMFYRVPSTQGLYLQMSGTRSCTGAETKKRKSKIIANIQVFRAVENIIFETEPTDTLPDVFFENNLSFPIDSSGNHLSNGAFGDQSQDISLGVPAIIQTGFFNCFAFGNGAESYKIRDSIIGRDFNLGNRVTTVAAQDYKESRRFADITYSGVYNPETNVNKLNEFNGALLNYKNLELSFGTIYILDGRETDVLVLQEDKVSYVLAGKNLLSDAAAGGAITSVPEVLGTQIARVENYGISFNPESYTKWGYDKFFTDAKRGAVIQLKGNSYSNEQLAVISDMNMRTWFRDEFISRFNNQKLGAFDPYMNEYVLTLNDREIPMEEECIGCGVTRTFTFAQGKITSEINFCVDFATKIGPVNVDWLVQTIDGDADFVIDVEYDGTTYTSGLQTTSGYFDFFKIYQSPSTGTVTITATGNVVLSLTVGCPVPIPMTLIEVVLTDDCDAGLATLKQFNYVNGPFTSPIQSNFFIFASGTNNPLVSYYLTTSGFEGQGSLPPEGALMTLQINETPPYVSYVFEPGQNKFRYLRSTVLYGNNDVDMQAMLSFSSIATPIVNPSTGIYNAAFTVPPTVDGQYLYAIWDLRSSIGVQLCYHPTALDEVCCNCEPCLAECNSYLFQNPKEATEDAIIEFPLGLCGSPETYTETLAPNSSISLCIPNDKENYTILQGNPIIYMESCECGG
jgi:hypothetical protein